MNFACLFLLLPGSYTISNSLFFFENSHRSRGRWENQVLLIVYWLRICRTELDHGFVSSDDVWWLVRWWKRKCPVLKLTSQLVRTNVVRWRETSSPDRRIHLFWLRKKIFSSIICKSKPRIELWEEETTKTEGFVHLSLGGSVCLLSERVDQRELSVCQLVRLLVKLSVPSPFLCPSPQFQCVRRWLTRPASARLFAQW